MPTIETLKINGKIDLIDYPDPNEKITIKPRKPLNAYQIFIKNNREEILSGCDELEYTD